MRTITIQIIESKDDKGQVKALCNFVEGEETATAHENLVANNMIEPISKAIKQTMPESIVGFGTGETPEEADQKASIGEDIWRSGQ